MQKNQRIIALFLICVGLTLFIHAYVFPQLPDWFGESFTRYDEMVVPYGTNEAGLAISVLVTFVSLLPIFFLILVIVHFFAKHRSNLLDYVWTTPMKKIHECTENIQQNKISFFVLSTIISTMTVFTAVHTTTDNLLASFSDIIGFFDLAGVYDSMQIPEAEGSDIASEALIGQFGIFAFLLFGVGPVWILMIRWAEKAEIKHHPGPKALLSYLYALTTILVFVQIGFMTGTLSLDVDTGPHCNSDREPTSILEFTLYGQTMICPSLNFAVIIVVSILTAVFAYFVVTRILHNV